MPSVFISYSRADLASVTALHHALEGHGVDVWRDQEDLYGGQAWPKMLGEAVSAEDFFILCWSVHAQNSSFAELEWTTALALQKPIIPCLLDDTPLPASLRARQGIRIDDVDGAAVAIVEAIERFGGATKAEEQPEVLRKLASIEGQHAPEQVLKEARTLFNQQGWLVHGNVIQIGSGATVHVGTEGESKPKGLLEKWQTWATLLTALVVLLGLSFDLWERMLDLTGKEVSPHIVSLMPGIVLGRSLPKPGDEPETTYTLRLLIGTDTVTIEDFRWQIYFTGATEPTLKNRITQAVGDELYEGIDSYLQESQIPSDSRLVMSLRSQTSVYPSATIKNDANVVAEVHLNQAGESPVPVPIRPRLIRGDQNVTTVIIERD